MKLQAPRRWFLAALGAALALSVQASAEPEETTPAQRPEEGRAARIEKGLLPAVQLRGREVAPMCLHDRLDHYGASALSLAVIDDYDVVWARAWGTSALDREDEVGPEALFQAGSVSKPVAALVIAALAQKGELDLDQPVGALLEKRPEIREALGEGVLLRHLLSHTAGLPPHAWRGWYRNETLPATVQMLAEAELTPASPPGEKVTYSNPGYLLLQLVVEDLTGRPFARVAADELFSPLHLKRSSFAEPLPEQLWESAVWGHYRGAPIRGKGRMYPAAPAGLWATPSELARLTAEVMRAAGGPSPAIVSSRIAREMLTPALPGGERTLAWSLAGEGEGRRIFHDGRVAGFTAYAVALPERGQGLAVMANSHRSHPLLLEVARAVAAEYGWPGFQEEREVVHLSEKELRRFEGCFEYESSPGLVVAFAVRDGKLFGRTGNGPEWELVPTGEGEFVTLAGSAVFRFEVDEKGRARGFRVGVPGGTWARVRRLDLHECPTQTGGSV